MREIASGDEYFIPKEKLKNGCPFCGNKELAVTYNEGTLSYYADAKKEKAESEQAGEDIKRTPFMSVTTVCYNCHTRKYIALLEKDKVNHDEMIALSAEAWERRADGQ